MVDLGLNYSSIFRIGLGLCFYPIVVHFSLMFKHHDIKDEIGTFITISMIRTFMTRYPQ